MSDRPAVAVIGAGSAGTTAARRLHQLFDGRLDITVYERGPHAGGRAWDVEFAGTRVEVGGTVLHSTGRHTMALMELTGAKEGDCGGGIDGEEESYAFWTDVGFAGRARSSLFSLAHALRARNVSQRMIDDIVVAIVHNMYNQGGEISSFAGEVGLAGAGLAGGYLFSIDGANRTLFSRALDAIDADVRLNTAVTRIEGRTDGAAARYEVTTATGRAPYDAVVLAAPLALADLEVVIDGVALAAPVHPYQEVNTTLVVGDLSHGYFGVDPSHGLPSHIFVADSASAPFKSLGVTGFSPVHQRRIYKLFSAGSALSDEVLGEIFSSIDDVHRLVWRGAYPRLLPRIDHVPFVLAPGLYYGCAFETAAGAIEVEAVGGHNAGALAARHLGR